MAPGVVSGALSVVSVREVLDALSVDSTASQMSVVISSCICMRGRTAAGSNQGVCVHLRSLFECVCMCAYDYRLHSPQKVW